HVREKFALCLTRSFRLHLRILELFRLSHQLPIQTPRLSRDFCAAISQSFSRPRRNSEVKTCSIDVDNLQHFQPPLDGAAFDGSKIKNEQDVRNQRQVRKHQHAPERGVSLIRYAYDAQEEK